MAMTTRELKKALCDIRRLLTDKIPRRDPLECLEELHNCYEAAIVHIGELIKEIEQKK